MGSANERPACPLQHRDGQAGCRGKSSRWNSACGGGQRIRSIAMVGGDATPPHIPVLVRRVVAWLAVHDGGVYIDATFGAGGYTRAILDTAGARVIGIDRDQGAIARGADLVGQARGRL